MARVRGKERAHVFETLSDLQAIQSATRNKILRPVACNASGAFGAGEPCITVLGRRSSVLEDQ